MRVNKFSTNNRIDLYQLARLHKSSFDKSLATTLSTKRLSKLYQILFENLNFECLYIENFEKEILGAVIIKDKNLKKVKTYKLFYLAYLLVTGFFKNPIFWFNSFLKNRNLYRGLTYDYEISTIFVSSKHRSQNVGTELVNFLKNNNFKNIIVNTDIAENFYIKNGFNLVRVVNNISVFSLK